MKHGLAPDGFTAYPAFNAMPQAQGAYLTFPGLSMQALLARGGAAARFLAAYRSTYGSYPASTYAVYGVAAVQVAVAAVGRSDGTRKGVRAAVFSGSGVSVAADRSVLGRAFRIDPRTGDVSLRDVGVEVIRSGSEQDAGVITVP